MANKYAGTCEACGTRVAPGAGRLGKAFGKWTVTHNKCPEGGKKVMTVRFSSGAVITRNARGTCEDAPCCGCCTF